MIVRRELSEIVAFCGYKSSVEGETRLNGTVFFLGLNTTDGDLVNGFAVTARHVVEAADKNSSDGKLYLRLNTQDQGAMEFPTDISSWRFHPNDESVDVAACRVNLPPDRIENKFLCESDLGNEAKFEEYQIGVGDDVYIIGMFKNHTGVKRNIPIFRFGNIAAMRDEKIRTNSFGYIDAYLIECRSIGGFSGAPVFCCRDGAYYLLGLMHGHFDLDNLDTRDSAQEDGVLNVENLKVNIGIGIVVPSTRINEVFKQKEFAEISEMNRRSIAAEKTYSSVADLLIPPNGT